MSTSTRAIPGTASAPAHGFYPLPTGLKLLTVNKTLVVDGRCPRSDPERLRDGRVKSIVPTSFGVTLADKIAMSEENDGILGNLPRSRPGVRSDKRASASGSGSPPAPKPKRPAGPKAKPAAAKPKAEPKAAPPPPTPPPPPPQPSDPIGIALKAGETVALTGLKVAGRVAGEVMRRLPRP